MEKPGLDFGGQTQDAANEQDVYEENLRERLEAGDPDAVNDFYRHCARLAMRAKQSGLSREDVEDATQDALAELWQKDGSNATSISLFATINRRRQIDVLRKKIVRKSTYGVGTSADMDASGYLNVAPNPDFSIRLISAMHQANILSAALAQLPPSRADAFIATQLNDQSYEDYAAESGITPSSARVYANDARKNLRKLISRKDVIQ